MSSMNPRSFTCVDETVDDNSDRKKMVGQRREVGIGTRCVDVNEKVGRTYQERIFIFVKKIPPPKILL